MAKKKPARTAKKAAKKKASGAAAGAPAAETGSCTDRELQAAAVRVTGGELMARFGEAFFTALETRGIDIARVLNDAVAALQNGPASTRVSGEENGENVWNLLRREIEDADRDEPYVRVVGKVVEVLTVHRAQRRRKDHCSAGEVFLVFLAEIPQHSPYDPNEYRLPKPTRRGNRFAVTRDPGKTMIAGRLQKLKRKGYLTAAGRTRSGGERGYRLSENGRVLFNGWPDVPGLQLAPPDEHE